MENNNIEKNLIKTFVCNEDSIKIKYFDNSTTTLNYSKENINEVINEVFFQIENSLDYWKKYQIMFSDMGLISFFVFITSPVMSPLLLLSAMSMVFPVLNLPITTRLKKHKIYLEMFSENKEALQKGYPALHTSDLDYYSLGSLKKIKASLDEINETIKFEKKIKENRTTRTLGI